MPQCCNGTSGPTTWMLWCVWVFSARTQTDLWTHYDDYPLKCIHNILCMLFLIYMNPECLRVILFLQQHIQIVLLLRCELVVLIMVFLLELEETDSLTWLCTCWALKKNWKRIKVWELTSILLLGQLMQPCIVHIWLMHLLQWPTAWGDKPHVVVLLVTACLGKVLGLCLSEGIYLFDGCLHMVIVIGIPFCHLCVLFFCQLDCIVLDRFKESHRDHSGWAICDLEWVSVNYGKSSGKPAFAKF